MALLIRAETSEMTHLWKVDMEAEYAEMFEEWGMSPSDIEAFTRPLQVAPPDLPALNGQHLLFGFVERLRQSDWVPYGLFEEVLYWQCEHVEEPGSSQGDSGQATEA